MFTGIIEATGSVANLTRVREEWRLVIAAGGLSLADVKLGDSIAVNGCCLTVVEFDERQFAADVSNETMNCTSLGQLKTGSRVNLEKAMQATSRFGGHIVSGHVDGVGSLISSAPDGQSIRLVYEAPKELARYIAGKGSICIDGTSLTVNAVNGAQFTVNVIPHTQVETIIGDYVVGQKVNLEVDLVARYLERLMLGDKAALAHGWKDHSHNSKTAGIDADFLAEHGYK